MKNKIIVILSCILLIGCTCFGVLSLNSSDMRFHQHLETAAKQPCNHKDNEFCSHLPVVAIDTNSQELYIDSDADSPKSNTIVAGIATFDSPTRNNHINDAPSLKTTAKIAYRGHSSLHFDKKSYKINFVDDKLLEDKSNKFLGMPEYDEWVLNGPFLDKTLIRNYLCMNISGEIMPVTPEVRFCELFVDGKYQGLYLAMESIAKSKDRVNISAYKEGDLHTSYILKSDRTLSTENPLDNFTKYAKRMAENVSLEVIYPAAAKIDKALSHSIEQEFSEFEKALYSFDYDDMQYGYQKSINVSSFVDYFIINEFFKNYDAGTYSTYFNKDVKSKISIGPVWDFNNACDNYIEESFNETGFGMIYKSWYYMLIKDENFINMIIDRYNGLRKTFLSEEYLCGYIDDTVAYLGDAVDRNYKVWGYTFSPKEADGYNYLEPLERNPKSYEEAVTSLKAFITKRGKWLDENINNLKQYSHESKTKKFNH